MLTLVLLFRPKKGERDRDWVSRKQEQEQQQEQEQEQKQQHPRLARLTRPWLSLSLARRRPSASPPRSPSPTSFPPPTAHPNDAHHPAHPIPPLHLPPPLITVPYPTRPSAPIPPKTAGSTQQHQQHAYSNPGSAPSRPSEEYRAKLLRYREPDIDEEDEALFGDDNDDDAGSMSRGAGNRGGALPLLTASRASFAYGFPRLLPPTPISPASHTITHHSTPTTHHTPPCTASPTDTGVASGLENWDDDFLDQSSPSSSPKVSRMAGAPSASASTAPAAALRPRNSMDSAAWDMSSDDDEGAGKDPFPGALTPATLTPTAPMAPMIASTSTAETPRAKSPLTPTFLPSATNFNFPTSATAYAGNPRAAAPGPGLRRHSTRDSHASSRWEVESTDEVFYTPRDTMVFDFPSSSESHYNPTTDPRDSGSRYDPTPEPGYARGLPAEDDGYAGEADEEDEGDRTVTLGRVPVPVPVPVQIEDEDDAEYERELQARYHEEREREEDEPPYEGMPETASPASATFPIMPDTVRVSALPSSTSPPPPPSPTTASRSRSQLGHVPGRPSLGGGSSIFSSSVNSTHALMGKSIAPPSRYPNRPIGKENERPRRRLRKKSRPPGDDMGMLELANAPPRGAVPQIPPVDVDNDEMHPPERAETPLEPEVVEPEPEDVPLPPVRAAVRAPDPARPTPYTTPGAPTHVPPSSARSRFTSPPSASASPGAFLTRLSSITKLFPRSASASSFRPRDPPPTASRQQARAASEEPAAPAQPNGNGNGNGNGRQQPPASGPVIPGLPVASAAAAGAVLGHRRGKGSAPPAFVGDRERVEEMFGLRGGEVPPPVPVPPVPAPGGDELISPDLRAETPAQALLDEEVQPEPPEPEPEPKVESRSRRKTSWRRSAKSKSKEKEREAEPDRSRERRERPRSATVTGPMPESAALAQEPVPPVPPVPVPPPVVPGPSSYAPPAGEEKKEKRKPRKLSSRRPRPKEEGIKHTRDSLEGRQIPEIPPVKEKARGEEIPALPTVPSGRTLDLHGDDGWGVPPADARAQAPRISREEMQAVGSSSSPPRPTSPFAPRASSPLSSAPQSRAMSPITPISPSAALAGSALEKKGSHTSELKIPQRISLQQRSLKEGLTDVRQFAGVVEELRDLQTQHSTLLAFLTASTSAGPPVSRLPRAARRSSAASQHQIEAGLARLESGQTGVWWELAGVLVDLGGTGTSGSVRAAKDRIGSRITQRSGDDSERGTASANEADSPRRSGAPTPPTKSRLRSASAAPTNSSLVMSPSSPALPSSLESGPVPRSTSLGAERPSQRSGEETPKELSSRQLILLGEMLRESDTSRVVEYGERSEAGGRSRAASRAGHGPAGPPTAPPSRPPTQQSFNTPVSSTAERIGRPRRGSKIIANIRDIFGRSQRDSVDIGSEGISDAEVQQAAPPRRPPRSSSRPPTIQPKGGTRKGSLDNRKSPRKPSLGSIFGSRQAQEKGDRSLPPTIGPKQGRGAGNGSTTSLDTDLEDDSDWNRVEHGNDGIPTVRGRNTGMNTNGASKQPLAIQTAFERERTTSMRSVERPPLASAKLALTPENIRPLLSHAKAVKKQLEGYIVELRALQPPRGDMKL
ncbi:hypothetical protein CALCODRAFT_480655 [Calocera cornea HHB12733]|uniref:Uncharacterized protein n=1 Tax=Calocera cornea HHB12733 TaxID=1353952 RepID=A0A165IHE8_9BASI|nr:hypothetical protein CALCODRAFT_480655 [Calocera cornea HHB12733]